jgi:hypothetical protein
VIAVSVIVYGTTTAFIDVPLRCWVPMSALPVPRTASEVIRVSKPRSVRDERIHFVDSAGRRARYTPITVPLEPDCS